LEFLRAQDATGFGHKDVSYDPATGRVVGLRGGEDAAARVKSILTDASRLAGEWLRTALPDYAGDLTPDRVTLRTQEEATRSLRVTARNDLLHIDQFPTRPSYGRRVLRLSVNIHPDEPWVWATADRFPELLTRFAHLLRVPDLTDAAWRAETPTVVRLLRRGRAGRSEYDFWMLRLHHYLKEDIAFQVRAARRLWTFPAGSAWLLFSDGVAHAQLRGRYLIDHTFFVPTGCLVAPDLAPLTLLEQHGRSHRRAG
ncbi:MAG TPA: Kdo hydroxylase family protein, partial [Gemmataceae bacterium]|nr:Kdo hydroxylase family protein [Gemmataceae bacterium]